jgi:hypothetical protein
MSTEFCVLASSSVYREQAYIERCHCNEPATSACDACGRARCARHLERSLCNRCTQWVGRELDKRASKRLITASASGVVFALGTLIAQVATISLVGLPIAFATFYGLRAWQRISLVKKMGPALAASKGELPPPPQEPDFPEAPPPLYGP